MLKTDQSVWCWGVNLHGDLGDNTTFINPVPVQVLTDPVTALGSVVSLPSSRENDDSASCAIESDSSLWCWGNNARGTLGNGVFTDGTVAGPVSDGTGPLTNVVQASPNNQNACAVKSDHTLWCWGRNDLRQAGLSTSFPAPIRSFPQ